MYILIQGDRIFYKKSGKGNSNIILLHNSGVNHLFFIHQLNTLRKLGVVYEIDLPGHGKSIATKNNYSIEDLANIICELIGLLNLKNNIIIGLNNGANIGIDVTLRLKNQIQQLILIDPPVLMNKGFIKEINNFILFLESLNYHLFIDKLIDDLFLNTALENKIIANEAFRAVSKEVLVSIFESLILWNNTSKAKLANIKSNTLIIITDEHHCQFKTISVINNNLISIAKVIGSKCWATLEVPEQINAIIKRFIIINNIENI